MRYGRARNLDFRPKRRFLTAARCLLMPSLIAETSSLVAMEAIACGTPVVAFPVGALPEIIEPGVTGFLVDGRSHSRCGDARARALPRGGSTAVLARENDYGLFWILSEAGRHSVNTAMMRLEPVTSQTAFDRLAPEWQALWRRVSNASPFQSPEWLMTWWRLFGNKAPLVLTARDGWRLIAVLPLYLYEEAECCKLLPIGIGLSDYLDVLVEPGHSEAVGAFFEALAEHPGWEECYIPDLPPGAALLAAQFPAQLMEHRVMSGTCPVLALPSAVAGLPEVVPRKTLRDLRQARRRAAAAGTVEAIRADASTVSGFMQDFFRLHEGRWQPIAGHGVCADPVVRDFHLAAAQRMLDAGMLRLYLLQVGNSTAAAYYGFTTKRTAYAYLSGFDPEYTELSPGTQIVAHAIEEAVREGAREFHFLRGGEAYKYAWGAVDRPNTALTMRRPC